MARKNPYDAPVPRTLKADDATEVAMASKGTVLPVDDETNFGPLKGANMSVLAPEGLAMDPRALAERLAANAGRLPPTRTPTPRSRRQRPNRRRTMSEDEPTQLGDHTAGPTSAPPAPKRQHQPENPAALAKRLAEEARARIQAEEAAAEPAEDPVALAKRLAAEAKARIQAEEAVRTEAKAKSQPTEDPAAMARRLAAEAKARIAAEAKARIDAEPDAAPPAAEPPAAEPPAAEPPAVAAPPTTPKRSKLAARAPRARVQRSAKQALESLPERPKAESSVVPAAVETAPAPEPVPTPPEPPAPPKKPKKKKKNRRLPRTPEYLASLHELLPGATIERERPVLKPNVFKALWQAHQARAVKDGQLDLAGAATLLIHRIEQRAAGDIIGVQLRHQDTPWAVFIDRTDGSVLAIVPRPEIYLAGLQ